MQKLILKIYILRCKHYEERYTKAMDNMEKHISDEDDEMFLKYAKQNYKYRIKQLNMVEKHSKLIKDLV